MRFEGAAGTIALGSLRSPDIKVPLTDIAHSAVVAMAKRTSARDPKRLVANHRTESSMGRKAFIGLSRVDWPH